MPLQTQVAAPIRSALIILAWALLAGSASAAPPNILLILSDDQGWTDYGFMGHEQIRTPHLDRLARESLTFTRGYVPDSLCRPSLATIISGLYPHQHGIVGNDPPPPQELAGQPKTAWQRDPRYRAQRADYLQHIDRAPCLPRLLAERGYVSFQAGKWWEGEYRRGGFTEGMTHGDPERTGRHGDAGLKIGRETMQPVFDFMAGAAKQQKPFFVWYAPMLPHLPHNPPQRLLARYQEKTPHLAVARYWAMCEWFDETIGTLLDYLDKHGLAENTLVAYVTDNGWEQLPDREGGGSGGPRAKRSPYDLGIRTPIMIRWPGHVTPKRDEQRLASSIDLAPTLLKAAGVDSPSDLPGLDLLNEEARSKRDAIFGEIFEHDIQHMTDPVASLRFRWVIEANWKLILPHAGHEPSAAVELFDLGADPHERQNLAEAQPERVRRLARRVEEWWPLDQAAQPK